MKKKLYRRAALPRRKLPKQHSDGASEYGIYFQLKVMYRQKYSWPVVKWDQRKIQPTIFCCSSWYRKKMLINSCNADKHSILWVCVRYVWSLLEIDSFWWTKRHHVTKVMPLNTVCDIMFNEVNCLLRTDILLFLSHLLQWSSYSQDIIIYTSYYSYMTQKQLNQILLLHITSNVLINFLSNCGLCYKI